MAPDESLLGGRLISAGKLTQEQLAECLDIQARRGNGQVRLGQILVQRGYVAVEDVRRALSELGTRILVCTTCRVQINVPGAVVGHIYACQRCGRALQEPARIVSPAVHETWQADQLTAPGPDIPQSSGMIPVITPGPGPGGEARIGNYVLSRELGRGGMGVVHKAYDPVLKRDVAIKMILDPGSAGPQAVARFRREAESTARLRHPGIVALHEVGEHEGRPYIVMDYVRGETFEQLLKRDKVTPRRVAEIVRGVAAALDHAHKQGVIHRDVKPQNVLIDRDGEPRVMDFGLARDVDGGVDQLTMSGQVLGTPSYMAPEQAGAERGKQGPATDVWALGVVLYRALAGQLPFRSREAAGIIKEVLFDEPKRLRLVDRSIHPDLETITHKCLEKETPRRYASAGSLAQELRRFLDGEAIAAQPPGAPERLRRWVGRNRALAVASFLLIALLVGLAVAFPVLRAQQASARLEATAQARLGVIGRARSEAKTVWDEFEGRRRDAFEADASGDEADTRRERYDELLALGLESLEKGAGFLALVRESADETLAAGYEAERRRLLEEARVGLFEAAVDLGDVAVRAEQWSVAKTAYKRALALGVSEDRASSGLEGVDVARDRLRTERVAAVAALIARGRSGETARRPTGWDDAVFELVGLRHEDTAAALAAELDGIRVELAAAVRDGYLRAEEVRPIRGEGALVGKLEDVLDRVAALEPGEAPSAEDAAVLTDAERAVVRLDRRTHGARRSAREILAEAQGEKLGLYGGELVELICKALGRIGIASEPVIEALHRYLWVERDERRAAHAGVALCRLAAPESEDLLRRRGEQLGMTGPFWAQVRRHIGRFGAAPSDDRVGEVPGKYEVPEGPARDQLRRGIAARERGDLEEATEAFDLAVEAAPNDIVILNERGLFRTDLGQYDEALADLDAAISVDPDDGRTWSNRSRVLYAMGDFEGALNDAEQAVALEPDSPHARVNRAVAWKSLGELDRAVADLDRAIELAPEMNVAWVNRAMIKQMMKRYDEARADYDHVIARAPRHAEAWRGRSALRRLSLDIEGALADAKMAIELQPRDANSWHVLAWAKFDGGDWKGAAEDATRCLELDGTKAVAHARFCRARAREALGEIDGAIEDYERFCELLPEHGDVREARRRIALLEDRR